MLFNLNKASSTHNLDLTYPQIKSKKNITLWIILYFDLINLCMNQILDTAQIRLVDKIAIYPQL